MEVNWPSAEAKLRSPAETPRATRTFTASETQTNTNKCLLIEGQDQHLLKISECVKKERERNTHRHIYEFKPMNPHLNWKRLINKTKVRGHRVKDRNATCEIKWYLHFLSLTSGLATSNKQHKMDTGG